MLQFASERPTTIWCSIDIATRNREADKLTDRQTDMSPIKETNEIPSNARFTNPSKAGVTIISCKERKITTK